MVRKWQMETDSNLLPQLLGSSVFLVLSVLSLYGDIRLLSRPCLHILMAVGHPGEVLVPCLPTVNASFHDSSLFPGGSALIYPTCRYEMQGTPACVCRPKTRLASKSRHPIVGRRVSDLEVSDAGSCCCGYLELVRSDCRAMLPYPASTSAVTAASSRRLRLLLCHVGGS